MLYTHLRSQGPAPSEYLDHDLQRASMKRTRSDMDDYDDNCKRSKLDPVLPIPTFTESHDFQRTGMKRSWFGSDDYEDNCKRSKLYPTLPNFDPNDAHLVATEYSSQPTNSTDRSPFKSMMISTKSPIQAQQATAFAEYDNSAYTGINQVLHAVHVQRYGDPELRERWWEHNDPTPNTHYDHANAILRDAFLRRHQQQ
ncbi:hypothetical protein BCR43DRAFT_489757 [Syncephalastrum racemosum]|uniref:Uncharacterized protein n=1 Tax=Syncephalastrum racemosum TaxID=13706 RepID=A0A1X2HEU2_SYNRA|nr:hypothetical protein BCR43DRAFT_489757 [Syncephalastrum racemosum]